MTTPVTVNINFSITGTVDTLDQLLNTIKLHQKAQQQRNNTNNTSVTPQANPQATEMNAAADNYQQNVEPAIGVHEYKPDVCAFPGYKTAYDLWPQRRQ